MSTDYVKDLRRVFSGDGNLFLGDSLTDLFDRGNLMHVGFTEGGADLNFIVEDYDHLGGRPHRLNKREISARGASLTVRFAEPVTWEHWYSIIGEGALEFENNTLNFLNNQQVVLYGNNIQKLPYRNIQINEIRTSGATPVIYSGLDLENNFEIDPDKGTIQAKPNLMPQPNQQSGTLYFYSGAWNQPTTVSLHVGEEDVGEKRYVALLFLANNGTSEEGVAFYKCYAQDIQTVAYRSGESRIAEVTFRSAKDPTKKDEYIIINEQPFMETPFIP